MQVQNRKGIYVEDKNRFSADIFLLSRTESGKIITINKSIQSEKDKLTAIAKATHSKFNFTDFKLFKDKQDKDKKEISDKREIILDQILTDVTNKISQKNYKVAINKGDVKCGKQLYVSNKSAEDFFVLKQVQHNIKQSFKVKPSSRSLIVNQFLTLLSDGFPKVIVRADIKEFYESIPHSSLIQRINENSLLSYPSKKAIKDVLNGYWSSLIEDGIKVSTDVRMGVPRGIGISAYLAELYMRNFDSAIKALPNVTYFARYVDDIIIVFTPNSRSETITEAEYKNSIKQLLDHKTGLKLNLSKTKVIDLRLETSKIIVEKNLTLTFLGYQFNLPYKFESITKDGTMTQIMRKLPLEIRMSKARLGKYSSKITKAFEAYGLEKAKYLKKANRTLIKRIKYLTGNTQLVGNKDNVFVGIYFSNPYLSSPFNDLIYLNKELNKHIATLPITDSYLKDRLKKFSFLTGYNDKMFSHYELKTLSYILSIWK